ncbi:MAG: HNH endonuclease [Idiomarinaceae bacterium]|nr:HNH endonuclease [Idiomarinaceae bacterium]
MEHEIDETILVPRKKAKERFRSSIHNAWGWSCAYCGRELSERDVTLDHVEAKANGGLTVKHNLVSCCLGCNSSKGHQDWRDWYQRQIFYDDYREQWIEKWING